MYRCELCKKQTEKGVTQMKVIAKKRKLEKGFETVEEKKVCPCCKFK